ncbi:hypothetical protein LINPERPRIM_LOCUS15918 [Linum perenne]
MNDNKLFNTSRTMDSTSLNMEIASTLLDEIEVLQLILSIGIRHLWLCCTYPRPLGSHLIAHFGHGSWPVELMGVESTCQHSHTHPGGH